MARVCLNMIVKNESDVILECLESIVNLVDMYVICDTGSTDDTKEKIKMFFDKRNIAGEIFDHEFRTCQCHLDHKYKKYNHFHFGWNRTYALQKCIGRSEFILIMDADDILVGDFKIPDVFLGDQYYVRMQTDFNYYFRPLLIRNDVKFAWQFLDGLHEYLHSDYPNLKTVKMIGDYAFLSRRLGNRNKDPLKHTKDIEFLEQLITDAPSHTRYKHFLAQSYYDAGLYDKAINAYRYYLPLESFEEAKYVARLMIGRSYLKRGDSEQDMIEAFLDCFRNHPNYAEPMYELCRYFSEKTDYERAYYYGLQAINLQCPTNAVLYLWQDVYDYKLEDEMIWCATQLGKYKEALAWSLRVLNRGKIPHNTKHIIEENITSLNNLVKKCVSTKLLGIYMGPSPLFFRKQDTVFGSELSVKYLAKELLDTYEIIIIADNVDDVYIDIHTGLMFVSTGYLHLLNVSFQVMIVSRFVNFFIQFDATKLANKTFVWIHDVIIHPYYNGCHLPNDAKEFLRNIDNCIDGYICLSTWHRNLIVNKYGICKNKVHIIGHGIDAAMISKCLQTTKCKNRFIWISDYQRGLTTCLKLFINIRQYLPDAELHIYRDVPTEISTIYQSYNYIKFMGYKDNNEILESLACADYWLYPTTFSETYCISALEAQRLGCICIAPKLAGLSDTIADRGIVMSTTEDLKSTLLHLEQNPSKKEMIRNNAIDWAKTQTWQAKKNEWIKLIKLVP